ncbi:MAG: hydroxyethylthiazole kinase [Deltaproteobacteria bacterium]|nr:hydroxyethylthiazole kinase [Deltaproteobacteria bacterium]
MGIDQGFIWQALRRIRETKPVIHNITNYVVMNNTANALLALGASPVMAHAPEEAADMVGIASGLVINIGTPSRDWVEGMHRAMEAAKKRGIPIILDPVGAGATPYRTRIVHDLIKTATPAVIRGNASEITALAEGKTSTGGVDSLITSRRAFQAAQLLSRDLGTVVCVSGETDYVIRLEQSVAVGNGHSMMPMVTGLGCTATVLCCAFAAVENDWLAAAVCAMAVMGVAGEIAGEDCSGPGSFQVRFLDALYRMKEQDLGGVRLEGG